MSERNYNLVDYHRLERWQIVREWRFLIEEAVGHFLMRLRIIESMGSNGTHIVDQHRGYKNYWQYRFIDHRRENGDYNPPSESEKYKTHSIWCILRRYFRQFIVYPLRKRNYEVEV